MLNGREQCILWCGAKAPDAPKASRSPAPAFAPICALIGRPHRNSQSRSGVRPHRAKVYSAAFHTLSRRLPHRPCGSRWQANVFPLLFDRISSARTEDIVCCGQRILPPQLNVNRARFRKIKVAEKLVVEIKCVNFDRLNSGYHLLWPENNAVLIIYSFVLKKKRRHQQNFCNNC